MTIYFVYVKRKGSQQETIEATLTDSDTPAAKALATLRRAQALASGALSARIATATTEETQ